MSKAVQISIVMSASVWEFIRDHGEENVIVQADSKGRIFRMEAPDGSVWTTRPLIEDDLTYRPAERDETAND